MKRTILLKTMLLLCALIVGSSSSWADETSYTITFKDAGTDGDSSAKKTTIEDIISDGASYVSSITDVSNVYQARTGRGIKLGSSKANGSLTLNLVEAVTPTKITFNARKYNDSETSITVNGKEVTELTENFDEYTVNYNGSTEVSSIAISTPSKRAYITQVTVYYDDGGGTTPTCSEPTFDLGAGAYIDAQNVTISCTTEGATIYYTTDGNDPTNSSSVYNAPIKVSTTTTIKAMAAKDGFNNSTIASVAYTFPATTYNTIADLITAAPTEPVILNLTNAQVLGVGTNDMYVKDATDALDFYKLGLTYTAGQMLNGKVAVKTTTTYNGVFEVTAIGENQLVATDGTLPEPTVLANGAAATLENYKWKFVTVTGDATANNEVDGLLMYKGLMNYSSFTTGVDNLTATGLLIPYQKNNTGDVLPELLPTSIICHITLSKDMVTYCSNNKLDFNGTGLKVYAAKVEEGVVKLTEIDDPKVTNKKGIILAGTAGQTYDVPFNTGSSTSISNNELKEVIAETAVAYSADSKYNYILQNGAFYKATGAKLKAGKAYLSTTYDVTAAGAPSLKIVIDGETTGIDEVRGKTEEVRGEYFNLAGQRVAQPTKGLYIVNGRKVVIK